MKYLTVTEDALFGVIENIYAAPLEKDGWRTSLKSISQLFGAVGSTFSGTYSDDRVFRPTFMVADQRNDEAIQEYIDHYYKICERGRFSQREPVGSVYYDRKYFTEHDMSHSEYYDYVARHGGKYAMGTTLARPTRLLKLDGTQQCAIHFSPQRGHPDEHEISLFERLVPHIMRANQLQQKLNRDNHKVLGLSATLDALPEAVLGLSSDLRICFANSRAETVLRQNDGIATKGLRLCLANQSTQRVLEKTLVKLKSHQSSLKSGPGRPIPVIRPSGQRSYVLFVAPAILPEAFVDDIAPRMISFFVIISEPEGPLNVTAPDLADIFGLTRRESELMLALANGLSLNAYCKWQGISPETARWHLANIFSKTDTHKQADLIRIVCRLTATNAVSKNIDN